MMESVISRGKTKKEAIDKALNQLGTSMENVEIEVIEESKERFFGLFTKPAVVRVTKKTNVHVENEKADSPENIIGTAWITDGILHFEATETESPQLLPCERLRLKINGLEMKEPVYLKEGDQVVIEGTSKEEEGSFAIKVDEDELSAKIAVFPGYREQNFAADTKRSKVLQPKVKTVRTYKRFQPQAIITALKEKGIVYGISREAIEQACALEEAAEIEIARGLPVTEGKDGFVQFLIDIETHLLKPKEREDGTVDFREIRQIPSIKKEEMIATIVPPQVGKAGKTVTGKAIEPAPVHEVTVTGNGIRVTGTQVISTKAGTPNVQFRQQAVVIDVTEKLTHEGDVNIESGNVSFVGDLEVTGNIDETMEVQANGKILVHGNVVGAQVTAGSALVVNKNVVRGKLMIGSNDKWALSLHKQSARLKNEMKKFRTSLDQLLRAQQQQNNAKRIDFRTIIRVFIRQKYANMQKEMASFLRDLKNSRSLNDELRKIADLLEHGFVTLTSPLLTNASIFQKMEDGLQTIATFYGTMLEPQATVTLTSVQQSEIYCNGDVFLLGKGVYNTKVEAEGKVVAQGFIRGGSIYAARGISAHKVGTPGVFTELAVPEGEEITIDHVMEDSMIRIGKRSHTFAIERRNVRARIDQEGELRLS